MAGRSARVTSRGFTTTLSSNRSCQLHRASAAAGGGNAEALAESELLRLFSAPFLSGSQSENAHPGCDGFRLLRSTDKTQSRCDLVRLC